MYLIINSEDTRKRLDCFIKEKNSVLSRSYIKKLIDDAHILVNNTQTKAGYQLKASDLITLNIPAVKPLELKAENLSIEILYEDEDLIVVNKPAGMATHPGAGRTEGTLVNALLSHCKNLSGIGWNVRELSTGLIKIQPE